jgi:spore coat protein U-like protein
MRAAWRALGAALALLCAAFSAPAAAQSHNADGTGAAGQSRAVVVAPLSLIKTDDMDFGRIAARPAAGTVTINPTAKTCSVTGPILRSGACQPARFVGMATRNMNARISLDSVVNLTGPVGATPMVLNDIKLGSDTSFTFIGNINAQGGGAGLTQGNGNLRYRASSSTGIFTLNLGGTLNVNPNQAPGVYRGSIQITVQYQ